MAFVRFEGSEEFMEHWDAGRFWELESSKKLREKSREMMGRLRENDGYISNWGFG